MSAPYLLSGVWIRATNFHASPGYGRKAAETVMGIKSMIIEQIKIGMITASLIEAAAAAANVTVPRDTEEDDGVWYLCERIMWMGPLRAERTLRLATQDGPGMASANEDAIATLRGSWTEFTK